MVRVNWYQIALVSCAEPEVRTGGPDTLLPLKNHKNIGFLSNTGLDPLKLTELPRKHSILGNHRQARETPCKWCFAGGPMMARLYYLDPPFPLQLIKKSSPASLRCGPLAIHIHPSLVLVQPRKTRPCLNERLLMGRKESNQTNKSTKKRRCLVKVGLL